MILLNTSSSKGTFQNFQPQILLKNFRTYLRDFFREPLKIWLTKYDSFKDVFKDCNCIFTQTTSRAHIFITQSLFNERLSVTGYSLQTLLITFWRKICGSKFWQIFCGIFLLLMMKLTIPSQLIFAFVIFTLHICNVLWCRKKNSL